MQARRGNPIQINVDVLIAIRGIGPFQIVVVVLVVLPSLLVAEWLVRSGVRIVLVTWPKFKPLP